MPDTRRKVLKFDTKEEAERVKIGTIVKDKTLNNITVYEAMAADAVSYADALIEELDKKKIERIGLV